jgi:hypothetical protein
VVYSVIGILLNAKKKLAVKAQKTKNHMFSHICGLSKTNAVILLGSGHMLREEHIQEE